MPESLGDAAQIRAIGEQIATATILKMRETEKPKVEIPAVFKVTGSVLLALLTAGIIGMAVWIVGTLSEVQLAVREVNTQLSAKGAIEQRFSEIDRRVTVLEQHKEGKK